MLILALDTSGKTASCALLRDSEILALERRDAVLDHSRTLLDLCRQLLEAHGLKVSDIDAFAAVTGPGSFTGVRIGVAAVKGFGWTAGKPCAGVSSLAAQAYAETDDGVLCCRVTARIDEYYYAFFQRRHGAVTRLTADAVGAEAAIEAEMARHPGCRALTDAHNAAGAALAALDMAERGTLEDCHSLAPVYLKRPQAEREREARLAAQAEDLGALPQAPQTF